jgi:alkaline phosphatase D
VLSNTQHRGYGVVDVQPGRIAVALRIVDDVTRDDSKVSTLATFNVTAGDPRIRGPESRRDQEPSGSRSKP